MPSPPPLLLCGSTLLAFTAAAPADLPSTALSVSADVVNSTAVHMQEGSWPKAVIAGHGKCGTNALFEGLQRFGFKDTSKSAIGSAEEIARSGFSGEVNWPCDKFTTNEGIREYQRHFLPEGPDWLDHSTAEYGCGSEMGSAMPTDTHFFVMLCDPIASVWSRMNHLRSPDYDGVDSNPEELMYTVRKRMEGTICGQLVKTDPRIKKQSEVCYQYEAMLEYPETIRKWKEAAGSRVKFLLAEASQANSTYLVHETAAFLGKPVPADDVVGEIHSHKHDSTYLDPVGEAWETYKALVTPTLAASARRVRDEHAEFFSDEGGVAKWWPSLWE